VYKETEMESSFTLFRVRGITIGANWSWLFVFALFTWSFATGYFPRTYQDLGSNTYWAMGIITAVLFFVCIILHELGHAFRAQREGMEIESISLWIFGGVAKFKGDFPSAGAEFRIAIAGPAVTAVLWVAFLGVRGAFDAAGLPDPAVGVADYLSRINLILLGFNMIPALPLDGGRVLRSYLWHRRGSYTEATVAAARLARVFAYALIAFGAFGFITGANTGGIWFALMGWFLLQAAQSEVAYAQFRSSLGDRRVGDLMTANPEVVAPDLSIASFIEDVARIRGHSTYPVVDDEQMLGLISLRRAGRVPLEDRATATVRDVMVSADEVPVLRPDTDVTEAAIALQKGPGRAAVIDDGRIVGILSPSDIARAVELQRVREPDQVAAPRRRGRPLLWILGGVVVVFAIGILYQPPVVVLGPGTSFDVSDDISIKGVDNDPVDGGFFLTSVSVQQPTGFGFLLAMVQGKETAPVSSLVPRGVDAEEFFEEQRTLFEQTQRIAAAAAAKAAGMEVDIKGTGATVSAVIPGAPAARVLEEDDVITAVNGQPVLLADDVGRPIRSRPRGTRFEITFERDDRERTVELRSREGVVEGAPGIGVLLETRDFDVELPFDITFREREIGGPSAGFAYALAIFDLIEAANVADGRDVATTGTIDLDGRIGPVGGLEEKAISAQRAGADLFLVPEDEVRDARTSGLDVVGVSTLEDALRALRS
jgi:PDZ domain-containing secreted protein/Zn-dependent protease/CBS domain-containing protein